MTLSHLAESSTYRVSSKDFRSPLSVSNRYCDKESTQEKALLPNNKESTQGKSLIPKDKKSTQGKAMIPNAIKITTREVRFGLPCRSNISRQEDLFEIRITT